MLLTSLPKQNNIYNCYNNVKIKIKYMKNYNNDDDDSLLKIKQYYNSNTENNDNYFRFVII